MLGISGAGGCSCALLAGGSVGLRLTMGLMNLDMLTYLCRRGQGEVPVRRFAFGAEVGVVFEVHRDVGGGACKHHAVHVYDFLVCYLAIEFALPAENADVTEATAHVVCATSMEMDAFAVAFPPERRPVGDVAVVASERLVQTLQRKQRRAGTPHSSQ